MGHRRSPLEHPVVVLFFFLPYGPRCPLSFTTLKKGRPLWNPSTGHHHQTPSSPQLLVTSHRNPSLTPTAAAAANFEASGTGNPESSEGPLNEACAAVRCGFVGCRGRRRGWPDCGTGRKAETTPRRQCAHPAAEGRASSAARKAREAPHAKEGPPDASSPLWPRFMPPNSSGAKVQPPTPQARPKSS